MMAALNTVVVADVASVLVLLLCVASLLSRRSLLFKHFSKRFSHFNSRHFGVGVGVGVCFGRFCCICRLYAVIVMVVVVFLGTATFFFLLKCCSICLKFSIVLFYTPLCECVLPFFPVHCFFFVHFLLASMFRNSIFVKLATGT